MRGWFDTICSHAAAEYAFDNIGNRNSARAGGNEVGSLRQSIYIANSLNQYTQRTVPGAVDVLGIADPSAKVTVNDQATTRKADYFYEELAVNNAAAPIYAQINVVGAKNNYGAGGEDAIAKRGGRVYVPQAVEAYVYDADGNLTSDGRWVYTWDAENRLTSVQAIASAPVEAKRKRAQNLIAASSFCFCRGSQVTTSRPPLIQTKK